MMNVTTYNVYVEPPQTGDQPVVFGDARGGLLPLRQAGPAIIEVNTVNGMVFADPPLSYAGDPEWCAWAAPARKDHGTVTEVAINVINTCEGSLTINLSVLAGTPPVPMTAPITIVKSLS